MPSPCPLSLPGIAFGAGLNVVAAENFYGDLAQQIGGNQVSVTSILSDADTDPHLFETSASTARAVSGAAVVIYNGADYDPWMDKLLSASPNADRTKIVAADLVGAKSGDNPHLWYDPRTLPAVAKALADELAKRDPVDAASFATNLQDLRRLAKAHRRGDRRDQGGPCRDRGDGDRAGVRLHGVGTRARYAELRFSGGDDE